MKKQLIHFLMAAVVVSGVTSCIDMPQEQHTSYETITVTKQDIEVPVSWSATIFGANDAIITSRVNGQLMDRLVTDGQHVRKGQALFIIDPSQPQLQLTTAQANLLSAQAQCNSLELEYQSNRNLFEKGIVSDYMLSKALNDFEMAKSAVEQAKAAVAKAQLDLSYCTVTSPVDGMVGGLPVQIGEIVSVGTMLTTISGNTEMKAKFSITETQLQNVLSEYGTIQNVLTAIPPTTMYLKDGTAYNHQGKITSISGIVDKSTGSVACEAIFPNPEGFLYSGIQGTIQMPLKYDDVIIIPLTSIVRIQDKTLIYKVNENNCAESVLVEIAEIGNGKDAAIIDGLESGTVIVAKGAVNVHDGQQVIFPEEKTDKN